MKQVLTDRLLKSLKPAAAGKRIVIWDGVQPSFGIRVTDRGHVSFFVMRRLAREAQPTRIVLGRYPVLKLERARKLAQAALGDLAEGVHPRERDRQDRVAEAQKKASTFANVAAEFNEKHADKKRTAKVIKQLVDRELVSRWGERPIGEITRGDVIRMVEEIGKASGIYAGHQALTYAKRIFNWALAHEIRGLDRNPCALVDADELVGKRKARQRILSDDEIKRIWQAAGKLGNPFGPYVQFLLLTGARRNEAARATWNEIDLEKNIWTLSSERMKADAPHTVPLAPMAASLLRELPRCDGNKFVFSTTNGQRPISGFGKLKVRIDGNDGEGKMADWRLHDLRRTVRTQLAALGVSPFIAELVIGHQQRGVHAIYDLHRYGAEKLAALKQWEGKLHAVITPPPKNVVKLWA